MWWLLQSWHWVLEASILARLEDSTGSEALPVRVDACWGYILALLSSMRKTAGKRELGEGREGSEREWERMGGQSLCRANDMTAIIFKVTECEQNRGRINSPVSPLVWAHIQIHTGAGKRAGRRAHLDSVLVCRVSDLGSSLAPSSLKEDSCYGLFSLCLSVSRQSPGTMPHQVAIPSHSSPNFSKN